MTKLLNGIATAALAVTLLASAVPARAQGAYDGLWSVLIITEKGTCDRGYRYSVRIRNGSVSHGDPSSSSFKISGRVSPNGATRVSVARGEQSANGTGQINRNNGAGRWQSGRGECSGTWQAERRGT